MHIEYLAYSGFNAVYAGTAADAVELFLDTYRNKSISVKELRNGVFYCEIYGGNDPEKNCFFAHFRSRDEAKEFILNQKRPPSF